MSEQLTIEELSLYVNSCMIEIGLVDEKPLVKELDPMMLHGMWQNMKLKLPFKHRPILRPLSDMTDDELNEHADLVNNWGEYMDVLMREAQASIYLIRQGFDVFGWIETGLAIDKTKMKADE